MPYLGYILAQFVKAGQTVATALTAAASYVTSVGGSVIYPNAETSGRKTLANGSILFNGTSDYIETGIKSKAGARTFMFWMYPQGDGGNGYSLSGIQEGNAYLYIGYQNYDTSQGLLYFYAGSVGGSVTGVYVPFFKWSHLCVTVTSSKYYVYLNGVLKQTGNTLTGTASTKYLRIGAVHTTSNHYHNGFISNAAYWQRNLTQEEVCSVMNKKYADLSATETKDLLSWWNMDDVTVGYTTLPDAHGNYNGTLY